jgi:hypothetical protein
LYFDFVSRSFNVLSRGRTTTRGIPVILAMLGSLVSFLATVALIFTWLAKELFGE